MGCRTAYFVPSLNDMLIFSFLHEYLGFLEEENISVIVLFSLGAFELKNYLCLDIRLIKPLVVDKGLLL